jgi:kynurenine formamidase
MSKKEKEEKNISRQACDFCKKRKIKCVGEDGISCAACSLRKIPCTYNCPMKKRGPQPQQKSGYYY